jgi:DNA-binding CsgD family transcriptional regulator
MHGHEAARRTAGERPGIESAEPYRRSGAPIPSGMSRHPSRRGLEVIPGGNGAARGGSRRREHSPQDTSSELPAFHEGPITRANLLWAAAALLLEVIADEAPGDARTFAWELDPGLPKPDCVLFSALIREALGLLERQARRRPAEAALIAAVSDRLCGTSPSAQQRGEPAWPGERLTESETRVLRYLPTHMGVPEIAAELYLSANTVRTHLRHLYRKLGAHSRHEAVQRAQATGLLAGAFRRP